MDINIEEILGRWNKSKNDYNEIVNVEFRNVLDIDQTFNFTGCVRDLVEFKVFISRYVCLNSCDFSKVKIVSNDLELLINPPKGLMLESLYEEGCNTTRMIDILDNLKRCVEAKEGLPQCWLDELSRRSCGES